MRFTTAIVVSISATCVHGATPVLRAAEGPRTLDRATRKLRLESLRRAAVWQRTSIPTMDLLAGPQGPGALRFDEEVACDYVTPDRPPAGTTPKFYCDLGKGDVVKVKYGRRNGEVYAEVAGSRLLWALGFGADRMYPVAVTCRSCPIEPWWWSAERTVPEKTYEIAAIERPLHGTKIESGKDDGWRWDELDQVVDERAGGAPRAHRDALKLLMVLLQNCDTKADNQRMVCLPRAVKKDAAGNESCGAPFLYVDDLGVAFGKATRFDTSAADFEDWEGEPIWKDRGQCVGNLRRSVVGTIEHPRISEAGRELLAGLLVQLSDKQITDMFTAARMDRFHRHPERNIPISEWVRVFKRKRDEIVGTRCP